MLKAPGGIDGPEEFAGGWSKGVDADEVLEGVGYGG
jgi:hypothetical protein